MTHWKKVVVTAFILAMFTADGAKADQVSVDLDLTVTSPVNLAFVSLEMQVSAAQGFPLFLDPTVPGQQPTSFLTDSTDFPNYVFVNQSFDGTLGSPYWTQPGLGTPPLSQIIGGDSTVDFSNVTLAPGTYLLALVIYDDETENGAVGPFQVSPVTDGGNTFFQDQNSSPYSYSYSFDADNNTGTFVISPTAVPEPSTLPLVMISSGLGGLLWYRKSRNCRAASASE